MIQYKFERKKGWSNDYLRPSQMKCGLLTLFLSVRARRPFSNNRRNLRETVEILVIKAESDAFSASRCTSLTNDHVRYFLETFQCPLPEMASIIKCWYSILSILFLIWCTKRKIFVAHQGHSYCSVHQHFSFLNMIYVFFPLH